MSKTRTVPPSRPVWAPSTLVSSTSSLPSSEPGTWTTTRRPGLPGLPGFEGFQGFDLHIEVEHLTATEVDVAFAYTVTGTHQGLLQGHATTGKPFTMRGVQLGRFENGLLVERWGSTDQLAVMTQLGLA